MDPDAQLVERVRNGDRHAFGVLVRRYLDAAYGIALARLGVPADAEDACQDAFVIALERIDQCRHPEKFGAWLLTIVRNQSVDLGKCRRRRVGTPLDVAATACTGPDPQHDAQTAELRQRLLDALATLPIRQREVVLLFDFEGWSHREIADRLGISPESARVDLHKARKALRKQLHVFAGLQNER